MFVKDESQSQKYEAMIEKIKRLKKKTMCKWKNIKKNVSSLSMLHRCGEKKRDQFVHTDLKKSVGKKSVLWGSRRWVSQEVFIVIDKKHQKKTLGRH